MLANRAGGRSRKRIAPDGERWQHSEKPEGQRLKAVLKRVSLNNAISLMSFAGQWWRSSSF